MFRVGQRIKNPRSGKVFEVLKYQDNFYYMKDCQGKEEVLKKQLSDDIDFIYNYFRQTKKKKERSDGIV